MKNLIVLLALLFAASFASSETLEASDDTVTLRWKGVKKIGDQYCRFLGGGSFCIDTKDVISIKEEGQYTVIVMKKANPKLDSYVGKIRT